MVKVIYASTKDSDMFYVTKAQIVDPFFYVDTGEKKYVFLDSREFEVFKEKNKDKSIEPVLLDLLQKEIAEFDKKVPLEHQTALLLLEKYNVVNETIYVPTSFPLDMADYLRSKGVILKPEKPFFSQRCRKNSEEIDHIKASIKKTLPAFERIEEILRTSIIQEDKIIYKDETLTSELLKEEVELLFFNKGMENTEGIIISSSAQAAIPHHSGSGIIRPHQTIICDIFPRNKESGYFADITRTYIKGKPSKEVQKMYDTVLASQLVGIKAIKPGIKASDVHEICADIFLEAGFDVGDKGFIHSTGHGIGIDIHEEPRLRENTDAVLEEGNVITVEPGLYYPKLGGVRIEDDVLVTKDGFENLVNYHKVFVID